MSITPTNFRSSEPRAKLIIGSILFVLLIILLSFISSFFVIVDAGEVGVQKLFGDVSEEPLDPGFHLKNPFASIVTLSTRTEEYTMSGVTYEGQVAGDDSIEARASDGAIVWLDVTVLYRLDKNAAPEIYSDIGENYEGKIIRPEIRSRIREVVASYPVNDVYSGKRTEIVEKIAEGLTDSLGERGIILEDVLLRNVNLSLTLSDSIEEKLAAQQEAKKFDFILEKEEKEAERKRIEAAGQRDSQAIINESLSTQYLYYLYIQTLKDHTGTIYVPTEGGLPLFKGI